MMIALFRIQEACEGQIFVDGIDTATVPLQVLRSKLGTMSSYSRKGRVEMRREEIMGDEMI